MELEITAAHVTRGREGSPPACPLTVALGELGYEEVMCLSKCVMFRRMGMWEVRIYPQELRENLGRFDAGGRFTPGRYALGENLHGLVELPKPKRDKRKGGHRTSSSGSNSPSGGVSAI